MTDWTHRLSSGRATARAGALLGTLLQPPMVVALEGELGAGKTGLVRGIATGLGVRVQDVTSPTYALCIQHPSPRGLVSHLDLYRVHDLDDLESVGWWDLLDNIVLVEWASRVPAAADVADLQITLAVAGPRSRRMEVVARTPRGLPLSEAWRQALVDDRTTGA